MAIGTAPACTYNHGIKYWQKPKVRIFSLLPPEFNVGNVYNAVQGKKGLHDFWVLPAFSHFHDIILSKDNNGFIDWFVDLMIFLIWFINLSICLDILAFGFIRIRIAFTFVQLSMAIETHVTMGSKISHQTTTQRYTSHKHTSTVRQCTCIPLPSTIQWYFQSRTKTLDSLTMSKFMPATRGTHNRKRP